MSSEDFHPTLNKKRGFLSKGRGERKDVGSTSPQLVSPNRPLRNGSVSNRTSPTSYGKSHPRPPRPTPLVAERDDRTATTNLKS